MNGPWSLTAKAEDTVSVFEGIHAKLPDSQVEYAGGVQIVKELPSSLEGFLGPKFRTPDIPQKGFQYSKFVGRGCEPKTVRFLCLQ
jgi:hypothetical protein